MATDCRGLIEFCRAFERHQGSQRARRSHRASVSPPPRLSCDRSPSSAVDAVILLLTIGAVGVLTVPCFRMALDGASLVLPPTFELVGSVICGPSIPYLAGLVIALLAVAAAWEIVGYHARKCGNPYCKGLRKAVEFDIQLESEECVRCLPPVPQFAFGDRPLELGEDREELEAELKKMAPLNGRTVLIFRKPCGCPVGRIEVWGYKKVRRIKK